MFYYSSSYLLEILKELDTCFGYKVEKSDGLKKMKSKGLIGS